eukprot:14487638-Alexandrium_andersonii.AAC.1
MPGVRQHAAATAAVGAPATAAAVGETNEAPVEESHQDAHAERHGLEPFDTTCCCLARPGSTA